LVVVLALSTFLGSPSVSLAASRAAKAQSPIETLLSWLGETVVSFWEKEGGSADPYGQNGKEGRPSLKRTLRPAPDRSFGNC
jgi:hypothetical protein